MKRIVILLFGAALAFGCVARQDVINLNDRLSRLERKNAAMEEKLAATEREVENKVSMASESRKERELELRSESAGIHVKIDRLKEEIRIVNGRIEQIEHRLDRELGTYGDDTTRLGGTVEFNGERLARVEKYLNLEPMARRTPMPAVATPAPSMETPPAGTPIRAPRELSENELYAEAKQAFDQGEYEKARQGFELLLKQFPDSGRADNAQFWIGETYYHERWYEKAILEYQKVIENYSKGNKVAAAMLKQGLAFLNLGDQASARLTLKDLVDKYPSSNEAAVAKKKLGEF